MQMQTISYFDTSGMANKGLIWAMKIKHISIREIDCEILSNSYTYRQLTDVNFFFFCL